MPQRHTFRSAFLALVVAGAAACAHLPDQRGRNMSAARLDTADTRLGRAVAPLARAHPGLSGMRVIADGTDALAARLQLIEAAERTLDIQTYIWCNDTSGSLLFNAVERAAERGVRVRLLLDDHNTPGLDAKLAQLDAHPNIEVRLFNPFMVRDWRHLGNLADFSRLNRRMHNKAFAIDGQVAIAGGRNLGDEYFDAGEEYSFVDLEWLAVGPIVAEVEQAFDRYWASDSAFPFAYVVPDATRLLEAKASQVPGERLQMLTAALAASPLAAQLLQRTLALEWAPARLVSDDPAKGLGLEAPASLLAYRLREVLGTPKRELLVVAPYFVPTTGGVAALGALARSGVAVSVVTNSLEATDAATVHAGYAPRRKALLAQGVRLFEFKRNAKAPKTKTRFFGGSAALSLHAKVLVVDRRRVFIGSFNFDPRSIRLNTEMGIVVDSPALAGQMSDGMHARIPEATYAVGLTPSGRLQWLERRGGELIRHRTEPGASRWRRLTSEALSLLPIEWML